MCGRETDILIEGLCPDCYRKTHPLARVKRDVVGIVRCQAVAQYSTGAGG